MELWLLLVLSFLVIRLIYIYHYSSYHSIACMTWIGLVNNEPQYGYPNNDAVYLSVSCGLGLIGAFLFMYIYSIAVYFIGCVGGFFLAVFILSWKDSLTIQIVSSSFLSLTRLTFHVFLASCTYLLYCWHGHIICHIYLFSRKLFCHILHFLYWCIHIHAWS